MKAQKLKRTPGVHWLAFLPAIGNTNDDQRALTDAVRKAREAGAELFELACYPINGLTARQTAEALKEGGITQASYCRFYPGDGSCGDPLGEQGLVNQALATFHQDLTFIETLRIEGITVKYMTGPSCFVLGKRYGPRVDTVTLAREFYDRFMTRISYLGDLIVVLEYLRPGEDCAVENLGNVERISEELPRIGFHGDLFHMNERGENPAKVIRTAKALLCYLHAHGTKRVMPGMGLNLGADIDECDYTDWASIANALDEIGYVGPIVPEPFGEAVRKQIPALGEGLPPPMDPSTYYKGAFAHLRKVGIL